MGEFFFGVFLGAVLVSYGAIMLMPGWNTQHHRALSCEVVCGKPGVHDYDAAMCVCRDGKTHRGVAPVFYKP